VNVTVRNIGTAYAGQSTTRLSVSWDGAYEDLTTPALSPNQTAVLQSHLYSNTPFYTDDYTAVIDDQNVVAESNESNNVGVGYYIQPTTPCTPTPPPVGGITRLPGAREGSPQVDLAIAVAAAGGLIVSALWLRVQRSRLR
jgi:hypothetical protein